MKPMIFSLLFFALLSNRGSGQVSADSAAVAKRVDSLLAEVTNFFQTRKYQDALQVTQQAANEAKQKWGENNALYATTLHQMARAYYGLGQYENAEELYLKAVEIRAKVLGKETLPYAASLNNLGLLYMDKSDFASAEPMFLEVKEIVNKINGREHMLYITALNNLGLLCMRKHDYARSEIFYLEAKDAMEKARKKENTEYATILNNLGIIYTKMGDYSKAEPMILEVMELRKKLFGSQHPICAESLNALGVLYVAKGDYEKANQQYLEAKKNRMSILGKDHPDYAESLNNLAVLYIKIGNFSEAEAFLLEAKEIRARVFGKENIKYLSTLSNLANLYVHKGSYDKAKFLYLEVKESFGKILGKESVEYATALSQLASVYFLKEEYNNVEPLYLESKEIFAKTVGISHPEYASSLNNLANFYITIGKYDKAEQIYLEAKEIRAKTVGEQHPDYATTLNGLGNLYAQTSAYQVAESLYLESMTIRANVIGKQSDAYLTSTINLAKLYQSTDRISESSKLFIESNDLSRHLIEQSVTYSSEAQMLAYLHTFEEKIDRFQSFTLAHPDPELVQAAYNNALFYNGYLQENARRLSHSVEGADSLTQEAYERWQGCRRRLANEYSKPIAERRFVEEVEAEAEGYEKTLTRNLSNFATARRSPQWQEIQAALKPGEAAVEFIHYRYYTPKSTDSIFYAALVLQPGWSSPRMALLFEQRQIKPLLAGANTATTAGQCYAARGVKESNSADQGEGIILTGSKTTSLYQLLWAPIDSLLRGVTTVYYAPAGVLHRLNLAAMPVPGVDKILADKYGLVQMGSTRQLLSHETEKFDRPSTAVLYGGLKYDLETPVAIADSGRQAVSAYDITAMRSALGVGGGDAWNYLPGTEKEVENIGKALGKAGYSVQTYRGYEGMEARFKRMGKADFPTPKVLHIATHGFFFPDPKDTTFERGPFSDRDQVFKTSDNPLLRSGLVLSGANPAWAGQRSGEGEEDGILTAYEISQMNLSGTDLVVLSACETGLGDVESNEGVYGLKRAFKIAGAKYLMMSLWQVPDEQTQELMTAFYRNWLKKKKPIPEAFAAAQRTMRKRHADPFYWAGFILLE